VGAALLRRDPDLLKVCTWDTKTRPVESTARELEFELECEVSRYIGRMSVIWLSVAGPPSVNSERKYLERNSIAFLSRLAYENPSSDSWLGLHADRCAIRNSGLWNVDHVGEEVRLDFLPRLERKIDEMLGCMASGMGGA
jgi:hypothetical protein